EAIEELNYEPDARAQALRSGSTNTIGFIIPDLRNPHFVEYASGIELEARNAGYHMLLSSIALDEEYGVNIFKGLARRRIDGLIIANSFILLSEEAQKTLTQLRKRRLPIVELNDQYDVDCLFWDYRRPPKGLRPRLLWLRHRRIEMINGAEGPEPAEH